MTLICIYLSTSVSSCSGFSKPSSEPSSCCFHPAACSGVQMILSSGFSWQNPPQGQLVLSRLELLCCSGNVLRLRLIQQNSVDPVGNKAYFKATPQICRSMRKQSGKVLMTDLVSRSRQLLEELSLLAGPLAAQIFDPNNTTTDSSFSFTGTQSKEERKEEEEVSKLRNGMTGPGCVASLR